MKVYHCDACRKAFKEKEMRITFWVKATQGHKIKPVKLDICYSCYRGLQSLAEKQD
jgi:hypothetical protein